MIDTQKNAYSFADLCEIMAVLRSPEGCPWDKEQDHRSIRKNLLEEAYEAADAIDNADDASLCEELGDVLLQVVFHAQMATERQAFDIDAVCTEICKKLIVRHPHIFGNVKADTASEVLANWDDIKRTTKNQKTTAERLADIPKALPALTRAYKTVERAAKDGIDLTGERKAYTKATAGDALFQIVSQLVWQNIDPEEALNQAVEENIRRNSSAGRLQNET